jgi:chloramphenicol 3-O-phosphotransferase
LAGAIILLSGPVGAGKSAVAAELAALSARPTVAIEGDDFWFFIRQPDAASPRHRRFQMVMRAMTAAAAQFARDGYEVILDFSIPPWALEGLRPFAERNGVALHYVALRPSLAVCAARAAARVDGAIADYGPYRDLYADFDAAPDHLLSDESADAAALAALVRAGVDAGQFRLLGAPNPQRSR